MPDFIQNISKFAPENLSFKRDRLFLLLVFGTYLMITSFLAMHHEPWRDEAQDWLLARDLDFFSIIEMLSYSGHPILWYAVLKLLNMVNLPYASIFVLNLLIAYLGLFIFLIWSPFPKIVKVLITFSTPFLIEYSTIARSYSLSLLLLFSITALYEKREEYPVIYALLVSLLFNIHYLCLGAAFSLLVLFVIEQYRKIEWEKYFVSIGFLISGFLFAIWSLMPKADEGEAARIEPFEIEDIIEPAMNTLIHDGLWRTFPGIDIVNLKVTVAAISILFLLIIMNSFWDRKKIMFFLISSYAVPFGIFIFKLRGELRHHFFLVTFWLLALWMSKNIRESSSRLADIERRIRALGMAVLAVSLFISVFYAFILAFQEYRYPFSAAKQMAFFLRKNNLHQTHTIVSFPGWSGSALLPFLPGTKFYYPEKMDYGTFIIWTKEREYLEREFKDNDKLLNSINQKFADKKNILILLNKPIENLNRYKLKIAKEYSSKNIIKQCERLYLYSFADESKKGVK